MGAKKQQVVASHKHSTQSRELRSVRVEPSKKYRKYAIARLLKFGCPIVVNIFCQWNYLLPNDYLFDDNYIQLALLSTVFYQSINTSLMAILPTY